MARGVGLMETPRAPVAVQGGASMQSTPWCVPWQRPAHNQRKTVGAGARNVSLLLRSGWVECRPSWAPPISMQLLSNGQLDLAISVHAHCLRSRSQGDWGWRAGFLVGWFNLSHAHHRHVCAIEFKQVDVGERSSQANAAVEQHPAVVVDAGGHH